MLKISPGSLLKPLQLPFSLLLTTTLIPLSNIAIAAEGDKIEFADRTVCAAPEIRVPEYLRLAPEGPVEAQEIGLEGDNMELQPGNKVLMTGNAHVTQGARGVFADKITYDQGNYLADVQGNVVYYTENGDELKTDSMTLDVESFYGETGPAEIRTASRKGPIKTKQYNYIENYSLLAPFISPHNKVGTEPTPDGGPRTENRIWADKVEIEGKSFQRLENARLTQCPEGEDVMIYGDSVELDRGEGVGYAKNVTVKFKGVPLLYAPTFSFPLNDQRKSGFLAPSIGEAKNSGAIFALPYYFNLAENYDATLRPTWYSKRGAQLHGEFRYMNEAGEGAIRGEFLSADELYNDEDRYGYAIDFNQYYSNGWGVNIDLADVSDTSYLNDFRNDINLTSSTHVQQRGAITYNNSYIYLNGIASTWSAVAPDLETSNPYDRLPQVTFGVREQDAGPFELALDTEYITFDHDSGDKVTGNRVNVTPYIEMPYEPIYGYVKPKLAYHAIGYQLDNQVGFADDQPSVGVPIFSVDSGLYFERDTSWLGEGMTHTLEPRVMYVYAPTENQDDMPVFDTGEGSVSSYNVLFRENRFFGGDRVGDDNHIALGLTTRMISEKTGQERLRASIGQLYYFEDREVTLTGVPETETESDIFAEFNAVATNQIDLRSFLRWDVDEREFSNIQLGVEYEAGVRRNVTLDYYKDNISSEDVRLQFEWPFGPRWQFSTGQRYSVTDGEFRESSYGLIYDGCCWAVGLRASDSLQSDGEFNTQYMLTFELDGLGSVRSGF